MARFRKGTSATARDLQALAAAYLASLTELLQLLASGFRRIDPGGPGPF